MDIPVKLRGLDLFSGIGGIAEALEPWVETVAYCERERYPQAVLLSRMERGEIDTAPIWNDVTTLTKEVLKEAGIEQIDIISGGFPCQDISVAGRGLGFDGERSSLFHEIVRLAQELRPSFLFLENVPAILSVSGGSVLGAVLGELAQAGYDCRYGILSAYDMGAPHKRDRWWLVAHSNKRGLSGPGSEQQATGANGRSEEEIPSSWNVAHSDKSGLEGRERGSLSERSGKRAFRESCSSLPDTPGGGGGRGDVRRGREPGNVRGKTKARGDQPGRVSSDGGPEWWKAEPRMGRVVNGCKHRGDRLKALGNSVVPQTAREAWKRLIGLK